MLLLLACAVVALCALSLAIGTRSVVGPIWSRDCAVQPDSIGQAAVAVRIPRTLMAAAAGAALGLSGAIMQGVTRNPLADPGILGINNGAALAVVLGIAWFGIAAASTLYLGGDSWGGADGGLRLWRRLDRAEGARHR